MAEQNTAFQTNLTEGSVPKKLLFFALPYLAAMLLQAFYNVADMMIVGWFCSDAGIAAVGTAGNITIMITNMIAGLATGGTVLIAQYIGSKRYEDEKKTIATLFTAYGLVAVVMTAVLLPLVPAILRLLDTPPAAQAYAEQYLYICVGGTIFVFGYNAVSAVLRGMGNSKSPLLFVAIAALTNVVLDYVLIGPFGMGPAGAAIATVFSQALSFVLSIIYLRRRDFLFDFKPKSFKLDREKFRLLMKIGMPSSLQNILVSVSFLFLVSLANSFGLFTSSAYNIGQKVNSFAILPGIAMFQTVASMAGQCLGANDPGRAKKTTLHGVWITFIITGLIGAVVCIWPNAIMSIFNADTQTMLAGDTFLRLLILDAVVSVPMFVLNGLFMGGGHTYATLFSSFLSSIFFRIPLAYVFALSCGMGLDGIGLSMVVAPLGGLLFNLIYLKTGKWKERHESLAAQAVLEG